MGKTGSEEVDGVPKTYWVDIVRMVLLNISVLSVLLIFLGKVIEANQGRVVQTDGQVTHMVIEVVCRLRKLLNKKPMYINICAHSF